MSSTYTNNTGIEKPATGQQSGTWGDTTNTNFDIIDRSLNGVVTLTLSGSTKTLTTSDGALSEGQYKVLILGGTPGVAVTVTIDPNDQQKLFLVKNECGQAVTFTQGSGGNATVNNGTYSWIFADGAGSGAQVYQKSDDLQADSSPSLGGNLDVNGYSIVSSSNGDIAITPNGTGNIVVGGDLVSSSNGDINITPDGTGSVVIDGLSHPQADGSAGEFLQTDGAGQLSFATAASTAFTAGMLMPFAGSTAPSGWLLCYGQAVSRTTYSALFSSLGTTYGSGDGSTTFNLPDLRGRVIAGQDDMGGTSADRLTGQTGGVDGDTLGASGGAETHTLTEAQLAAHSHYMLSATQGSGAEYRDGSQYYDYPMSQRQEYAGNTAYALGYGGQSDTIEIAPTETVGSGSAHNNVQPTLVLNYIIKT